MKNTLLLTIITFLFSFSKAQIVITEINYNTPGAVDSLDFIEIYNNSGSVVNITGWKFKKAISHTIATATINAGQYKVFCYDSVAFYRNFGFSANQWRNNALSNSSDSLVLENATGTVIDFVYYKDVSPWPILADGEGPSMALCDANLDNNVGTNWTYGSTPTGIVISGKEIYAHPGAGCPTTDVAPPIPYSANETSITTVQVFFNEPLNATATVVGNYMGLGTVTSAVLNGTNDMVTLTLATPLIIGKYYVLTVNNIADAAGNTMTLPRYFNIVFNNTIGTVAIDELYYDDPFLNDTLEFIEIVNYGTSNVELGGYWFNSGVKIRLPEKTLAPNEYYVVAKDSNLIYLSYGVQAKQWSSGGLGNTSEALSLTNSLFQLVDSVYYTTASLTSTNGTGASLVICPPYTNLNTYNNTLTNWTAEIVRSDNANLKVVGGRNTIVSPGRYNCETNSIENPFENTISIYPSITNGQIKIDNNSLDKFNLKIINSLGKVIEMADFTSNQIIELSDYANGMYYFILTNSNQESYTYKIIKF